MSKSIENPNDKLVRLVFSDPNQRRADFIPDFGHILIDQSGIKSEEIKGALKARITRVFPT